MLILNLADYFKGGGSAARQQDAGCWSSSEVNQSRIVLDVVALAFYQSESNEPRRKGIVIMISSFFSSDGNANRDAAAGKYIAWIDGVGAWLILTKPSATLGRVSSNASPLIAGSDSEEEADVSLVANLSRHHATIDRVEDNYVLAAKSGVKVQGRPVSDLTLLPGNCEITLGDSVRLGFSIPTPLSATARLTFDSDHRPRTSVDGVVLMAETCVLGPAADSHIRCREWSDPVVLVQTPTGLVAKSKQVLSAGNRVGGGLQPVADGQVVSGESIRFRLEPMN